MLGVWCLFVIIFCLVQQSDYLFSILNDVGFAIDIENTVNVQLFLGLDKEFTHIDPKSISHLSKTA